MHKLFELHLKSLVFPWNERNFAYMTLHPRYPKIIDSKINRNFKSYRGRVEIYWIATNTEKVIIWNEVIDKWWWKHKSNQSISSINSQDILHTLSTLLNQMKQNLAQNLAFSSHLTELKKALPFGNDDFTEIYHFFYSDKDLLTRICLSCPLFYSFTINSLTQTFFQ